MLAIALPTGATTDAEAAAKSKRVRVSLQMSKVVLAGDRVTVRGRVRARGGKVRGAARSVSFQQRVGRRWIVRSRGRARARGGRFAMSWRAPGRKTVLRVRAVVGNASKPLGRSRARRIAVTRTDVLRPQRVLSAPSPGQPGVLRYRGRADVSKGKFVALGAGAATPYGLLGRVVAVKRSHNETSISIVPATLPEAIPEGSFSVSGARSAAKARAAATARPFTNAMSCDGSAEANLRGSVSIDIDPHLSVSWGWRGVRGAEASVRVTGAAELAAAISAQSSCSLARTQIARWDAPSIRFSLGPFPVVVVPQATLSVAANAQASASASTSISGSVTAKAGLRKDGDDIRPIGEFGHTFSYAPPQGIVKANLSAQAIPAISFLLYGVAGPQFDLSAGLDLAAHPASRPWWQLRAPVKLDAKLAVPGFDKLSVGPWTVYERTFDIASANSANPDPTGGPPPAAGERARIDWDTDDTDVDLHIWDELGNHAYYVEQEAIPDATLSVDITSGFGPEIFTDHFSSSRTFTYGLCYFSDHGNGPTNVTTRLIDPNGGIRTFHNRLAFSKDRVLLGSSPANGGYVPDDDWC